MNTLFISTFNESVIIGYLKDGILILDKEVLASKNHSVNLVPTIESVLNETKIDITTINDIIIVNGPGSFTGVRLGVTVAKTLSYTLKAKIKTITSIEAISLSNPIKNKIVIVPDNKGVYYGIFENNQLIDNINYLSKSLFEELLLKYKNYKILEYNKLDLELIYKYLKDKESVNTHNVNPVYIKKIEVLNGK